LLAALRRWVAALLAGYLMNGTPAACPALLPDQLEGVVMHSCCFHAAEETDLVASEAPAGHSYGDGDEGAALSAAQHVLEVVRARVTHAPLAPLLAALLPRGAALRSLELYFCWLDEDWCAGCVCLEATTSLKLSSCSTRSAAALVRAAPALRRLTLLGALPESGAMPRFVTALRGITALSFRANNLRHLPPGPYLAGGAAQRGSGAARALKRALAAS
jgi:hypothetical protein